jgi:dihydropteroate synthase-like protein
MPRYLFVTGRLAEESLRATLAELAPKAGFEWEVAALRIDVAALMTPAWVARKLTVPPGIERVILPGHCRGDLPAVQSAAGVPVELGPEDLRDLPQHFGLAAAAAKGYGAFDIEIIAEINHAPRLTEAELLCLARRYRDEGADVIDVGCDPGGPWAGVGHAVRTLRGEGFRVSVDSWDPREIAPAVEAGAELVLSVNGTNLDIARGLPAEVVAVPDTPADAESLDRTVAALAEWGTRFRLDPILEPIGFGFAASLERYWNARRRHPGREMMMGVGNLSELTGVDSAGVNTVLAGFCQELGVRSVLTTEVANPARSSVRELDLARRLVRHAVANRTVPKHLEPRLNLLRPARPHRHGGPAIARMAAATRDRNFRIFAEDGWIYVFNSEVFLKGRDPFELFDLLGDLEPSHAFYLGYELSKAVTAITLDKSYHQDRALDWGFLTVPEESHREKRKRERAGPDAPGSGAVD